MTVEVRQEAPWTLMFAHDIVICGGSMERVKPGEVEVKKDEGHQEEDRIHGCKMRVRAVGRLRCKEQR